VTLFGNRVPQMVSLGWAVIQHDHALIKKRKCRHRDMHIRKITCEDGGRDWSHVSTSQGNKDSQENSRQ
jgi:hypothetical protein